MLGKHKPTGEKKSLNGGRISIDFRFGVLTIPVNPT